MEAVDDSGGTAEGGPTPIQTGTHLQELPKLDCEVDSGNLEPVKDAEKLNIVIDRAVNLGEENVAEIEQDSIGIGNNCVVVNGKRKRNRRKQKGGKHHRKWKPYDKLTWDERKTLEERETKRACKKRESRFASGQAMAPYNTTQFLMEQHEPSETEVHFEDNRHSRERMPPQRGADTEISFSGGSGDGSSEEDSNGDEEIFLEKDFTEAYEQYQSERLENMTKGDLVREHLQLEEEVESLKKQLKTVESENRRRSSGSSQANQPDMSLITDTDDVGTLQVLQLIKQVKKLKDENELLKMENDQLLAKRKSDKCIKTMDVSWSLG